MTADQIIKIKATWKIFRGIDPILVGDTFYSKLFADNPSLRKMFPRSMEQQYQKIVDMLSTIVGRLDQLDQLTADISIMARRHIEYGVKPAHYKMVGDALLWTLQQGLGKDWTGEVSDAWTSCYERLSRTMIEAAT